MGRWRPPPPVSSKYITPEGKQRLEEELEYLWRKKRPEVTRALSEAAAETYDNLSLKRRDYRALEVEARVVHATALVLEGGPLAGAWVTVEDEAGYEIRYRIVGPDETDYKNNWISMDSPLGRSLMGKGLDAEVEVETPQGKQLLYVVNVEYEKPK